MGSKLVLMIIIPCKLSGTFFTSCIFRTTNENALVRVINLEVLICSFLTVWGLTILYSFIASARQKLYSIVLGILVVTHRARKSRVPTMPGIFYLIEKLI